MNVSEACCPLATTGTRTHGRGTNENCLLDLPPGTRVRVRELRGNRRLRSRLYSLGLLPGAVVTLCGRNSTGCRIQMRDTCVVLDCESAGGILCWDALRENDVPGTSSDSPSVTEPR